jgi:hypothetical protein
MQASFNKIEYSKADKDKIAITACLLINTLYEKMVDDMATREEEEEAWSMMLNCLCLAIAALSKPICKKDGYDTFTTAIKQCIFENLNR